MPLAKHHRHRKGQLSAVPFRALRAACVAYARPASKDNLENAYTFERRVDIQNAVGSENRDSIVPYKRDVFLLEANQPSKGLETKGWDKAMQAAYN